MIIFEVGEGVNTLPVKCKLVQRFGVNKLDNISQIFM